MEQLMPSIFKNDNVKSSNHHHILFHNKTLRLNSKIYNYMQLCLYIVTSNRVARLNKLLFFSYICLHMFWQPTSTTDCWCEPRATMLARAIGLLATYCPCLAHASNYQSTHLLHTGELKVSYLPNKLSCTPQTEHTLRSISPLGFVARFSLSK